LLVGGRGRVSGNSFLNKGSIVIDFGNGVMFDEHPILDHLLAESDLFFLLLLVLAHSDVGWGYKIERFVLIFLVRTRYGLWEQRSIF
jgi:hypothetical protein